jgi:oligoribonuclease NrnB/cAMP/cGMP phosphodiesterase (DHH superfamily)
MSTSNSPLCIYHGNCADGFGAAWVVRQALPDAEFYPGVHGQPAPAVQGGRMVILVDFSYPRAVLQAIAEQAGVSLLVIDHHKTAAHDLEKSIQVRDLKHFLDCQAQDQFENCPSIYKHIDMYRSGAGLTWDFFFPGTPRPKLLNHIEDQDLWRFDLPRTREIQAALFSYPYDFATWDLLMKADLRKLAEDGAAIERKHHKDIDELLKVVTRRMRIGGHEVPVANLPYTLTSDAGHKLAQGEAFAACYWDTPSGRQFSLRSVEGGADVAAIAEKYKGGGHRTAAGFCVTFEQAQAFELSA